MKSFQFRYSATRVDGLRIIASLGDRGSVLKMTEKLAPGTEYHWPGASSIVARGSILVTFQHGEQIVLRPGDVMPSVVRHSGDVFQEALEDQTLIYCFRSTVATPTWIRGFKLEAGRPLALPSRPRPSRCILITGRARCNDQLDISADKAPHVLKVSPDKALSFSGEGVLLYAFESGFDKSRDPIEDDDPMVDDYNKGVRVPSLAFADA